MIYQNITLGINSYMAEDAQIIKKKVDIFLRQSKYRSAKSKSYQILLSRDQQIPIKDIILPNSMWDLLSDFSLLVNSPQFKNSSIDLSLKSQLVQSMNLECVPMLKQEISKKTQKAVMTLGNKRSMHVTMAKFQKWLLKYKVQIIEIAAQYRLIEELTLSLMKMLLFQEMSSDYLTFDLNQNVEALLRSYDSIIGKMTNLMRDLNNITSILNTQLNSIRTDKDRMDRIQASTKFSIWGLCALGIAVGVVFPIFAAGGFAFLFLSGQVMFTISNSKLTDMKVKEELMGFIIKYLTDKKKLLESALLHFAHVRKQISSIKSIRDPSTTQKVVRQILAKIPIRVADLLMKKPCGIL